ncbi:chromosome segregation protein SMC [Burkholderia multivorans]|uniref:AAA family ATPase n=1 Tax=Burkholderia multivorans TaxID=87883 RepID=UPI0006C7BDBC|nr:ATP-binding protein [Burkholderia multivorans]KPJ32075.1 chromosome segregation protein SMC [Burkholderia multivorans]MBU9135117.1 AAA family ATPase [Burkholderia multivorans]MBU9292756.1 AAA family ATPase [Burkholderia multivorans]MBU9373594.1 AAA family ATPase [Burkholderia multivorans]MDN7607768.1 AAA family ATPase [Burkholderia multivorans]
MLITHLRLKNWRNFKHLDVSLGSRTYVIGANASGKSNLLDVFRFLRDICKPAGGGLQKAIATRGGLTKLRCLQARTDNEVEIHIALSESTETPPIWEYTLAFKPEGRGLHRIMVTREIVKRFDENKFVLNRPDKYDSEDSLRLTQTALEQINANSKFREIADFFQETTYLHLVPQLLKHSEIASHVFEGDPFGQGLLHRIAKTSPRTRDARLKRIQQSLTIAVPQFKQLKFEQDKISGLPHLVASYEHWRTHGAWQREDQFSDGTLRLLGILWMLQDTNSLLLLEEPELSLNDAIVSHIPLMIDRVLRQQKAAGRQVIITTHSEALLDNPLDGKSIILLEPKAEGTIAREPDETEIELMEAGLSPANVLLPKTRPAGIDQLGLF